MLGKASLGRLNVVFLAGSPHSHGGPAMAAHLTLAERQFLHRMAKAKKTKAEIGALMNRHRSTIYRELKRNSNAWGYRPETAQRLSERRRQACRRPYKLKAARYASVCQRASYEGLVAGPDRRSHASGLSPTGRVAGVGADDLCLDQALCAKPQSLAQTGPATRSNAENPARLCQNRRTARRHQPAQALW